MCRNWKKLYKIGRKADIDPDDFDVEKMFRDMPCDEYEGISRDELFHMFFDNYHYLDVVDTGFNDCYSEEYAAKAQKNADLMNVTLDYVEGSNHLLEKLISGNWDERFLVAEAVQKSWIDRKMRLEL